jgi:hypothetical protein
MFEIDRGNRDRVMGLGRSLFVFRQSSEDYELHRLAGLAEEPPRQPPTQPFLSKFQLTANNKQDMRLAASLLLLPPRSV